MATSRSLKLGTPITEQIELLKSRGMTVDDELAIQWLQNVSYYRLSGYWFLHRLQLDDGTRSDRFIPGTNFSDVVALYEADRKLRTLIHDGIERVEIAFRTRIIDEISIPDPLAYRNPNLFRTSFKHTEWLKTAERRIQRAKKSNRAISHYQVHYGSYPLWVLAEVLDFSDISKLYDGMTAKHQRNIAESFGLYISFEDLSKNQRKKINARHPLASWLEQLTIVRNHSAHHARIWNQRFIPAATPHFRLLSGLQCLPEIQNEQIYGSLHFIAFLMNSISPGNTWMEKVNCLIDTEFLPNPLVSPSQMGL